MGCLSSQVGTSPAESSGSKSIACAPVYAEPCSSSTRVFRYNIRERVSPKLAHLEEAGTESKGSSDLDEKVLEQNKRIVIFQLHWQKSQRKT